MAASDFKLLGAPYSRTTVNGTFIKVIAFYKQDVGAGTQIAFKVPPTGRVLSILMRKLNGSAAAFAPELKSAIVLTTEAIEAYFGDSFPDLPEDTYDFGSVYVASSAASPRNLEVDRAYIAPDERLYLEPNPDAGSDNEVFGYISIQIP